MTTKPPDVIRLLMLERERLFSYIWAIVGDVHLAEDVFQEVSLFVIEKRPEVPDALQFRVWLRQTARYKSLEALRRVKRRPLPLDSAVLEKLEEHWVQYDSMAETDLVEFLRECIRQLTPNGKKLIAFRYVEGLHSSEIARRLGRQVESVYQAIARAHRSLLECIRKKMAARTPE